MAYFIPKSLPMQSFSKNYVYIKAVGPRLSAKWQNVVHKNAGLVDNVVALKTVKCSFALFHYQTISILKGIISG